MGKPRKMKPYTPKWEKMANEMARRWAPTIYPCPHCRAPYFDGHICPHCNEDTSGNPEAGR